MIIRYASYIQNFKHIFVLLLEQTDVQIALDSIEYLSPQYFDTINVLEHINMTGYYNSNMFS